MFRTKICGITTVDDALSAVDAGADAIGLNFYPLSKRYVPADRAEEIVQAIDSRVLCVGVFVNSPAEEVDNAARRLPLSAVQLHGDEPPEFLAQLKAERIVRAWAVDQGGVETIAKRYAECREAGRAPEAVLLDAPAPGEYGGSGEPFDWRTVAEHPRWLPTTRVILAGGLTAENVGDAIRLVRPHGVDVASGVEAAPGRKCPDKMRQFVANARAALAEIAS